jgi:TolA-binding protein
VLTQIAAGGLAVQVGASSLGFGKAAWFSGPVGKLVSALALASVAGAGVYAGTHSTKARVAQAPQSVDPTSNRAPVVAATKAQPTTTAPALAAPEVAAPEVAAPEAAAPAAPEAAAPAAPAAVSVPVGARASSFARVAPATPPAATPAIASADTLADETRLLRAADQALRSGDAQRAVSLLDEHAARYPHGALAPERGAERMIARCQLGQGDASSARSYLTTHPDSAFTARIRDACGISR